MRDNRIPTTEPAEPSLADRIRFHKDRVKRSTRTRAGARHQAARALALLEVRDVAYRRLLVRNRELEADRRFAEAVGAILTNTRDRLELDVLAERSPIRAGAYLAISDRFGELELDHDLADADR